MPFQPDELSHVETVHDDDGVEVSLLTSPDGANVLRISGAIAEHVFIEVTPRRLRELAQQHIDLRQIFFDDDGEVAVVEDEGDGDIEWMATEDISERFLPSPNIFLNITA